MFVICCKIDGWRLIFDIGCLDVEFGFWRDLGELCLGENWGLSMVLVIEGGCLMWFVLVEIWGWSWLLLMEDLWLEDFRGFVDVEFVEGGERLLFWF